MKITFYLIPVLLLVTLSVSAQNVFFTDIVENNIQLRNNRRVVFPVKYRTTSIDFQGMKTFLGSLPSEQTVLNRNQAPVLALPMPDGSMARFRVWESSIQEPELQNQFPEIRTYAGQGIDDPLQL